MVARVVALSLAALIGLMALGASDCPLLGGCEILAPAAPAPVVAM